MLRYVLLILFGLTALIGLGLLAGTRPPIDSDSEVFGWPLFIAGTVGTLLQAVWVKRTQDLERRGVPSSGPSGGPHTHHDFKAVQAAAVLMRSIHHSTGITIPISPVVLVQRCDCGVERAVVQFLQADVSPVEGRRMLGLPPAPPKKEEFADR